MKTEADVSRVDQDRLEQIALQLYSQAVAQRFAIDDEMARKCFVEANRFLRVAAGVRDGSIAAEPAGPPPFESAQRR
jgi:hypothetical protein